MEYTVTIQDLIKRPIIRNDFEEEWMNKMTDEELAQFEQECYELCLIEGTPETHPDIITAYVTNLIDRGILYSLFKERSIIKNQNYENN